MNAQAHRPVAGTPIVAVSSRQTIGFWMADGPLFYPDQRMRFVPYTPVPISYRRFNPDEMETIQTYDVWRTWGNPDRGHQVWLTTASDPRHLHWVKGMRPIYGDDCDEAADAEALRRVLKMRGTPFAHLIERQRMEDYANHLDLVAAEKRRRAA